MAAFFAGVAAKSSSAAIKLKYIISIEEPNKLHLQARQLQRLKNRRIRGGRHMPTIAPISDLRNYGQVLENVKPNAPVYLTKNGRGEYSLHRIEDDEEFEKAKAMIRLLTELNRGFRSGEEQGWLTDDDVDRHFAEMRRILGEGVGAK